MNLGDFKIFPNSETKRLQNIVFSIWDNSNAISQTQKQYEIPLLTVQEYLVETKDRNKLKVACTTWELHPLQRPIKEVLRKLNIIRKARKKHHSILQVDNATENHMDSVSNMHRCGNAQIEEGKMKNYVKWVPRTSHTVVLRNSVRVHQLQMRLKGVAQFERLVSNVVLPRA